MKTPEELSALKNEVEALNQKLSELTDEELAQVAGGVDQTGLSEVTRLLSEAEREINKLVGSPPWNSDLFGLKILVGSARDALSRGNLGGLSPQLDGILKQANKLDLPCLSDFSDLISQALTLVPRLRP